MDLGLNGQVALVAASSKGLGQAIATGFAAEGIGAVISGHNETLLSETAGEIREFSGAEVDCVTAGLSRVKDVGGMAERTMERFGSLDVLVTNAGGSGVDENRMGLCVSFVQSQDVV